MGLILQSILTQGSVHVDPILGSEPWAGNPDPSCKNASHVLKLCKVKDPGQERGSWDQ